MKIKDKNAKKVSGKQLSKTELDGVSGGVTIRRKTAKRKATKRKATKGITTRIL